MANLKFLPGNMGSPILKPLSDLPEHPISLIAFSKAISSKKNDSIVHFYEADKAFARIMHDPQKYSKILSKFKYVISPDFSQHMDMPSCLRLQNSWWNKVFGAYWQTLGMRVIPNVSWSSPDSYEYAFSGIPQNSVIAINCSSIKGNPMSRYFWMKGYEATINVLNPRLIIRYGDKMPGEDESRSIYYENENLMRLRNGRQR